MDRKMACPLCGGHGETKVLSAYIVCPRCMRKDTMVFESVEDNPDGCHNCGLWIANSKEAVIDGFGFCINKEVETQYCDTCAYWKAIDKADGKK